MIRFLSILAVLTVAVMFVTGCEKKQETPTAKSTGADDLLKNATDVAKDAAAKIPTELALCGKCGQIKGSPMCCKPGAKKCDKCGMAKGSPGCCKGIDFDKGDVTLCSKCGMPAGSDLCCKPDAAKCTKCGMAKGSPGCCAIKM